ncbi:MAG: hypothetical protein J0L93_07515 [Deltaproteobacteria bacterium]|nr:hypothetical protein [Deltaproteobacteria bacterium]
MKFFFGFVISASFFSSALFSFSFPIFAQSIYVLPGSNAGFGDLAWAVLVAKDLKAKRPHFNIKLLEPFDSIHPERKDIERDLAKLKILLGDDTSLEMISLKEGALKPADLIIAVSDFSAIPKNSAFSANENLNRAGRDIITLSEYTHQNFHGPLDKTEQEDLQVSSSERLRLRIATGPFSFGMLSKPISLGPKIQFPDPRGREVTFVYSLGSDRGENFLRSFNDHLQENGKYGIAYTPYQVEKSELPRVELINLKGKSLNYSAQALQRATTAVHVTGDISLSFALQYDKVFSYAIPSWKRGMAYEIRSLFLQTRREEFQKRQQSYDSIFEWMSEYGMTPYSNAAEQTPEAVAAYKRGLKNMHSSAFMADFQSRLRAAKKVIPNISDRLPLLVDFVLGTNGDRPSPFTCRDFLRSLRTAGIKN